MQLDGWMSKNRSVLREVRKVFRGRGETLRLKLQFGSTYILHICLKVIQICKNHHFGTLLQKVTIDFRLSDLFSQRKRNKIPAEHFKTTPTASPTSLLSIFSCMFQQSHIQLYIASFYSLSFFN